MKTIGENIRELRKAKGISQEELALQLEVSRQTVFKWEKDIMHPNMDSVKILCDYFEISPEYLFEDVDKEQYEKAIAQELVVSSSTKTDKKLIVKIILISLTVFEFFIFSIFVFLTVCWGLSAFSQNLGHDNIASISIDVSTFVAFLISSCILLVLNVFMVIYLIKTKK